jgi:hypothetical protein
MYMQHGKHALCRHVPKNRLQTDTNFLRVVTCTKLFTHKKRSALQWNVSEDKNAATADRVFDSCLFLLIKIWRSVHAKFRRFKDPW